MQPEATSRNDVTLIDSTTGVFLHQGLAWLARQRGERRYVQARRAGRAEQNDMRLTDASVSRFTPSCGVSMDAICSARRPSEWHLRQRHARARRPIWSAIASVWVRPSSPSTSTTAEDMGGRDDSRTTQPGTRQYYVRG
jgi:hypothetical protein